MEYDSALGWRLRGDIDGIEIEVHAESGTASATVKAGTEVSRIAARGADASTTALAPLAGAPWTSFAKALLGHTERFFQLIGPWMRPWRKIVAAVEVKAPPTGTLAWALRTTVPSGLTIVARSPKSLGLDLEIQPKLRTRNGSVLRRIITGHGDFDQRVTKHHGRKAAIETLDQQQRVALLRLSRKCHVVVKDDTLTVHTLEAVRGARDLVHLTRATALLAQSLSSSHGESPRRLLLRNALFDASWGARKRSVELLCAQHRDTYEARLALARALEDPDARVRLAAAARLGVRGLAIARAIMSWDGETPGARKAAFELLAARLDDGAVELIVDEALTSRCDELLLAAVERIKRLREAKRIDQLQAILRLGTLESAPVLQAIVRTILELGEDSEVRAMALALSQYSGELLESGVLAVIEARRPAALAPLSEILQIDEKLAAYPVQWSVIEKTIRSAQRAVRKIALPPKTGRLSLVENNASRGALSEIAVAAGGVSIAS